jgi:hypothetical protein
MRGQLDLITLGVARTPVMWAGCITPAAAWSGVAICRVVSVVVIVISRFTAVYFEAPRKFRREAARGPGAVPRAWKRFTRVAFTQPRFGLGSTLGAWLGTQRRWHSVRTVCVRLRDLIRNTVGTTGGRGVRRGSEIILAFWVIVSFAQRPGIAKFLQSLLRDGSKRQSFTRFSGHLRGLFIGHLRVRGRYV